MFIRKLKSRNGNVQVQVLQKVDRKNIVVKHLGTARTDLEITQLVNRAQQYIDNQRIRSGRVSLFDTRYSESEMTRFMARLVVLGAYASVTHHFFTHFYKMLQFDCLKDRCFCDLVIARIVNPVSKARTKEWLENVFGRVHSYSLTEIYRTMERTHRLQYQNTLERQVWDVTTHTFPSDVSVLFFDVTTLYYEAFDDDDLRKCGYSKDRKDNQPQLIVALTVNTQGIPLQVKVFPGNKFEGHTMIPCISEIKQKHDLRDFVVVADSAMVSTHNMIRLQEVGLKYIIGARLGNLSRNLYERVIQETPKIDGSHCRFYLGNGQALVVSYSIRRANKDRTDRNKQLMKAQRALSNPSGIVKRYKFLRKSDEHSLWELNQENIDKATMLEGLKGYVTNHLGLSNREVIDKYAALWQVERSFRISKSDLKARPIFHTVREKIEAHITIVFAALAITKYVEITTHMSISKINELLHSVQEVRLKDTVSGDTVSKYTQIENPHVLEILKCANIDWVT